MTENFCPKFPFLMKLPIFDFMKIPIFDFVKIPIFDFMEIPILGFMKISIFDPIFDFYAIFRYLTVIIRISSTRNKRLLLFRSSLPSAKPKSRQMRLDRLRWTPRQQLLVLIKNLPNGNTNVMILTEN